MPADLLELTDRGLFCPPGGFYIDPWQPVDRAVVTHAHSDHAARGSARYLSSLEGYHVLRVRMDPDAVIDALPFGEPLDINGVRVSLHPAGHILGSAQVRLEHRGQVAVVSGDYKDGPDRTCTPFEPVRCHLFLTESTFGLPVYRWPSQESVFDQVNAWWRSARDAGKACLLYGYALGKAQRLLSGLDPSIGPIYTHGAVEPLNQAYRDSGIDLPPTTYAAVAEGRKGGWAGALIVAPPSAHGTPWTRRFGPATTAFASGWMRIRGTRRRRAVDRGFVLSDHADWPGLLASITATGAERVWVTHGYSAVLTRYLRDRGLDARAIATRYEGETDVTAAEERSPEDAGE